MNSLLESAKHYNSAFGFNVVPVQGNRPAASWLNWQIIEQSPEEIEALTWGAGISGIGGICGINDLRILNFVKISDPKIVTAFCAALRLKTGNRWIVKSGDGYQLWIRVRESESLIRKLNGPRKTYRLFLKSPDLCGYIELKWSHSQSLLPYSIDNSGNRYSFLYDEPRKGPSRVNPESLLECIDQYCDLKFEAEILKTGKGHFQNCDFDREKLGSAIDFLTLKLHPNDIRDRNLIAGGLASLGEDGRNYFLRLCLGNPHCTDSAGEIEQIFDSMRKIYGLSSSPETVYKIAEKYGWVKPAVIFWETGENGVSISRDIFKKFLEENGFCKQKLGKGYMLLKIEKNIVHEVEIFDIKDFVITYIREMDEEHFDGTSKREVLALLINGASRYFSQSFIEFLETRRPEFMRDTKDKAYLFFRNCFLEISRTQILSRKYEELQYCIWNKQIIPHSIRLNVAESEFARFIRNICNNAEQRILSLRSAIGYLLHNFKDSANAKAVIFLDEKLAEGAYGRSGKGLVAQAIGKLRKTVRLDGRNFNFAKNFSFQSVSLDTAVIEFNDASKKFNFDKLFAIITDDITVEKKNKDELIIPFKQSPKIIISTNYTIAGSDDSTLDRQFVVEFSDHYNKSHRPIDEFGRRFFDEWNNDEWNSFYNYLIGCIQLYLKRGLIQYAFINLKKKKLIDATCPEFVEFFESLILNQEFNKKKLYEEFLKNFDEVSGLSYLKFSKWIREGANIKGYKLIEHRSGSNQFIELKHD